MSLEPELPFVGVRIGVLQGAVAGGIVAALLSRGAPWWWRLTTGIVGILAAMYATPLIEAMAHKFVAPAPDLERALSFTVGLVGKHLCEALLVAAARVRNRAPGVVDRAIDTKLGGGAPPAV